MRSLNPETKAYQIVYEFFAQQIYEGKLKLGSRLPPERDISDALGVSRNSVREGIRMLEMLGFVESRQGSGNYIRSEPHACMTEAIHMMMVLQNIQYMDLHQTRRAVELEAMESVVNNLTDDAHSCLSDLLTHMDGCTDAAQFYFLERSFHRHLIDASGNDVFIFLNILTSGLEQRLIESHTLLLDNSTDKMNALRQLHHQLYDALVARDHGKTRTILERYFDCLGSFLAEK